MAQDKKMQDIAEANRVYFLALANSRGSIHMLPTLAGTVGALLAVLNVGAFRPDVLASHSGYEVLANIAFANVILMCVCGAFLAVSLFKKLLLRFQVFFSYTIAALALALVYVLCLLGLVIATLPQARGERIYATLFTVVGLAVVLFVAGATGAHVVMLRRRLSVGHSEKRTLGNYIAVSRSNRSKTYWLGFGVMAVLSMVIGQGQYFVNFLGFAMLALFACVMTSLPVEFAYLAYLKSKDRGYWEALPRLTAKDRQRLKEKRLRLAKKAVMGVLIAIAVVALIWVLDRLLPIWFG